MSEQAGPPRTNWIVYICASLYLSWQALWRFFARADEWPPRSVMLLELAVDIGMSAAAIALYFQLDRQFADDDRRRPFALVLLVMLIAAILTIFLIRFSSDVGWRTGHRLNWND